MFFPPKLLYLIRLVMSDEELSVVLLLIVFVDLFTCISSICKKPMSAGPSEFQFMIYMLC